MSVKNPTSEPDRYDVIVIGGGINGCAATQELAAAGYRVVLVEKNDFGAGSSSRSTRLIHCGLRYLAPGGSPYAFLRHPSRFITALKMTRKAMQAREEFIRHSASRARKLTFGFPVWKDMNYRPWHVDLALRLVDAVGPGTPPLDRKLLKKVDFTRFPLFSALRDQSTLIGVNSYTEYQFDWAERVAMDMVLDAKRLGAECLNYNAVVGIKKGEHTRWCVEAVDVDDPTRKRTLYSDVIVNTAGIWIDRVNALASSTASRRVLGTKGVHIVLRLPEPFKDQGVISMNRKKEEPVYLVPWKHGLHYMGVTETVYEGDLDDIHADDEDIDWLLAEFNHLLPGMNKTRGDVLYTWAGVRPLTYDPALPKGARNRVLVNLADDGLPGMLTMTAGPVTTHRSAGREITHAVSKLTRATGTPGAPDYRPAPASDEPNSPALLNHDDSVTIADLRHAARHEQARTLIDLLARRTGVVWTATNAREGAQSAASSVADIMGWDEEKQQAEVQAYLRYLDHALRKPN